MSEIMVDSNVILDVITEDPQWFDWSSQMLTDYANQGDLVINPIIYAEIAIGFNQPEEVEEALPEDFFRRDPLPYSAAFLAGQSFLAYRRRGGERRDLHFLTSISEPMLLWLTYLCLLAMSIVIKPTSHLFN